MSKRLRLERDYAEQLRQEAEEEDDKLKKLQERIFAPITWARLKFGFKIQDLREDRYADCIDMIINYHVKTEVLCRNTELIDDEVSLKYYLAAVQFFMKDSTSIIAINEENNETAGVLIIKKVNKQDYDHIFMRVSYNEGEARRKCMEIKNAMARKLDIFKTHDSVVLYYLLCIKEQYRHLGLGYQLMRIGLDVARSLHSSIVVGCFTDFKTQKCAKRLNFQPPVAAGYWSGVFDATKVHGVCPQRNIYTRTDVIEGEEDCLYLNVYTPRLDPEDGKVYPVMMFIHGGGWLCGGGNSLWYGPEILLDRDVVLVVPNYRLGALGFLTTGDEVVPGNNGLKDQVLVLKWIKENIAKFGGDPASVTIFGESAGGASAHYHMLSPLSKGLFKNAISESGTALCPWAFSPKDEGLTNSRKLAKLFDCPTGSSREMVECLRKVKAEDIISKDGDFMSWDKDPMIPFKPVVEPRHDGAFIVGHPIDTIKSGLVNDVPWVVGLNTDDGALRVAALYGVPNLIEELDQDFNKKAAISLIYDKTADNWKEVSKLVRKFYFGDKKLDTNTRQQVLDLYTDGWFLNGADQAVYLHKKYLKNPIYYYLFGHRGVASFSEVFGDKTHNYGVCHADELQYLFPVADGLFPDKTHDDLDKNVAKLMTTLWVNFAKYNDPTPEETAICHKKWTPVESGETMEYFYIGGDKDIRMESGLYLDRAKFWRNLPINSDRNQIIRDEL